MDTPNKNDDQPQVQQAVPVQTIEQPVPPADSPTGSAFHRLPHKWLLLSVAVLVVLGGIGTGIYALTSEDKTPAANTSDKKNTADKDKEKDNLAGSEAKDAEEDQSDENKESSSDNAPGAGTPAASVAPNSSTLTVTGVTTMTPDYYSEPGVQSYKRIDFTIHNDSSVERTYGSQYGANYMVRGITPSGEIKEPHSLPGTVLWQSSTIAAGGTAEGYILFDLGVNIAQLEWKAPGNADTLYYPVPAQ